MSNPKFFAGTPDNMGVVHAMPEQTFEELVSGRFVVPAALSVTRDEMFALPKDQQNEVKAVDYVVPATFRVSPSPRKTENATTCNLVFVDIDDSVEAKRMLKEGFGNLLGQINSVVHHTARSTPDAPRLRVMVEVDNLPAKHYAMAATHLAGILGMSELNKESKVSVQPMYLPVQYKDSTDDPIVHTCTNGNVMDTGGLAELADATNLTTDPADAEIGDIMALSDPVDDITVADVEDALTKLDAACSMSDWVEVGMALKHQFGDAGFEVWDNWSSQAPAKYPGTEVLLKRWGSFKQNPNVKPVTVRTLFKRATDTWSPPIPLDLPTPAKLDLNQAIPPSLGTFRDFVTTTAESVQVPVDAVAALSLGVIAGAAARSFEIRLSPQWVESSVLWIAALAEPGERKSALLRKITAPLYTWQKSEHTKLGAPLALYSETRKTDEAALSSTRRQIANTKPGTPIKAGLQTTSQSIVQRLLLMPELTVPELLTADFTPEAARKLMVSNGEKLIFASAETDFQQLTGSRYGNGEQNLNLLLAAKSGDSLPSHRMTRSDPLDRPALGIVIFVQPRAVFDVVRDENANGRGLVQRFLFIQAPSRMGYRSLNPPCVPPQLEDWWSSNIVSILDIPWPGRVVLSNSNPIRSSAAPRVLDLEPSAETVFFQMCQSIEDRLRQDRDLRVIAGFGSKLPGEIARIALSLEILQNSSATSVTGATMSAACHWVEFLISHHRAVLGQAGDTHQRRHARRLIASIQRDAVNELTERDCLRRIQNSTDVTCMSDLSRVLEELVQTNHLRRKPAKTTSGPGRPSSPKYEVNPHVIIV